ncbi:MAG: PspA/IM30 family protein [Planctomycetaceae bacterium]|nr:PspA/IM30 family protein [Planctomycetaceae bacterium]
MPYFSRLTDIVTCNLTEILSTAENPAVTLREILDEMEEGLSSARRVAKTSLTNRDRLQQEIDNHTQQIQHWLQEARTQLTAGNESVARDALMRKVEVEDLVDGLRPELEAASSTWKNMLRIQKALEARHAEAVRRLAELTGSEPEVRLESETAVHAMSQAEEEKRSEVEAELEALRRQLGN